MGKTIPVQLLLQGARQGSLTLDIALARPQVAGFYDKPTGAIQYVVADPATKRCAVIDPILDFDE
ncbi:hypothetical protein JMG10_46770, partial [Nostoc ellipsosporum NOK]|nr:hypothetical protein [Nostoc ellipsosporum NOK]